MIIIEIYVVSVRYCKISRGENLYLQIPVRGFVTNSLVVEKHSKRNRFVSSIVVPATAISTNVQPRHYRFN